MSIFFESYYETLASFDVVLVQLAPNQKYTTRRWDHFEEQHDRRGGTRIDLAREWLHKGFGVGFLPRNGLFVVDCDDPATIERMDTFIHKMRLPIPTVTTASGKKHYYGVLPSDLLGHPRLKNHLCHPEEDGEKIPWDFKLGERTLIVAAGTEKKYETSRVGRYHPDNNWGVPPVFDPRLLAPCADFFHPETPFLRDTRSLRDRIAAAISYLQYRAPISILSKGARKSLHTTASHLVAYLGLDPALAVHLMTHDGKPAQGSDLPRLSWNRRCRNVDGSPFPWEAYELREAVSSAVDSIPQAGIQAFKKQELRKRQELALCEFISLLECIVPCDTGWMYFDDLYGYFLDEAEFNSDEFTRTRFGKAIAQAVRAGVICLQEFRKGHGRWQAYTPLSPSLLAEAKTRRLTQKKLERVA